MWGEPRCCGWVVLLKLCGWSHHGSRQEPEVDITLKTLLTATLFLQSSYSKKGSSSCTISWEPNFQALAFVGGLFTSNSRHLPKRYVCCTECCLGAPLPFSFQMDNWLSNEGRIVSSMRPEPGLNRKEQLEPQTMRTPRLLLSV